MLMALDIWYIIDGQSNKVGCVVNRIETIVDFTRRIWVLTDVSDILLAHILELWGKWMSVFNRMVIMKSKELCPNFSKKNQGLYRLLLFSNGCPNWVLCFNWDLMSLNGHIWVSSDAKEYMIKQEKRWLVVNKK